MKKIRVLFVALLALTVVLCLGACDKKEKREPYTAYEITKVDIVQKTADTFSFTVASDIAPSDTAKVYITRYDRVDADAQAISYDRNDGKFVFEADVPYNSYFIRIVDGEKTAVLPMTRPQMAPALNTAASNNVLTYNFVNGTSWSSFCDPTGKSVYKSSSPVFDENAQLVAKNVNIFGVDSTTDTASSENMPYYYVVLSSKNGIVTYVSAPVMTVENAFSNLKVTMIEQNGAKLLQVSGKFVTAGDVALEFYSANTKLGRVLEIVGDRVSGQAGEKFSVTLDMSQVVSGTSGAGIWYDIKLASSSGSLYELPDSIADLDETIKDGNVTFMFREWNHILKLNYEIYDFDVSAVKIELVDGVPTLIVEGVMDSSLRDIKLHGDAQTEGQKKQFYWDNLSEEDGKFLFRVALTELPDADQPWTWFHLYTYKGNATVGISNDLNRGPLLQIGEEFIYDGVKYTIQAYQGTGTQLAIEALKQ